MTLGDRLVEHVTKLHELDELPRPRTATEEGSAEYHKDGIKILQQLVADGWTDEALK